MFDFLKVNKCFILESRVARMERTNSELQKFLELIIFDPDFQISVLLSSFNVIIYWFYQHLKQLVSATLDCENLYEMNGTQH